MAVFVKFVYLCTEDGFTVAGDNGCPKDWSKDLIEAWCGMKRVFGREKHCSKIFNLAVAPRDDKEENIWEFCHRSVDVLNDAGGIGMSANFVDRNMVALTRLSDQFGRIDLPPLLLVNERSDSLDTSVNSGYTFVSGDCKAGILIDKSVYIFTTGKA